MYDTESLHVYVTKKLPGHEISKHMSTTVIFFCAI